MKFFLSLNLAQERQTEHIYADEFLRVLSAVKKGAAPRTQALYATEVAHSAPSLLRGKNAEREAVEQKSENDNGKS